MVLNMKLFLVVLVSLVVLVHAVHGLHVLEVYRLFSMERDNTFYGSNAVALNSLSSLVVNEDLSHVVLEGGRKALIVPFDRFQPDALRGVNSSLVGGIVVVFPDRKPISPEALQKWKAAEASLYEQSFDFPIYFAPESRIADLQQELLRSQNAITSTFSDSYQIIVSGDQSTPEAPSIAAIHGWLVKEQGLPTVALVAHYDSFGIAPGLSTGASSNAGSVVALLELARLFSKLYTAQKSPPSYNLLFIIAGGSRLNFAGSRNWLNTVEPRVLESLEFALCLDTILGSTDNKNNTSPLFFHVSRSPKDVTIANVYQAFLDATSEVSLIQKKINVSNSEVFWEHEQFSRKRVAAATVSALESPVPVHTRSDIFDSLDRVDVGELEGRVKVIGEALAKHLYKVVSGGEVGVFEGSNSVSRTFLTSWLETLTSFPRAEALITKESQVIQALEKVLVEYTSDVSVQWFLPESEYKFAGPAVVSLSAYKVKPFVFDLLITAAIFIYLAALYIAFKGTAAFIQLLGSSIAQNK